jgi:hypothetical protein
MRMGEGVGPGGGVSITDETETGDSKVATAVPDWGGGSISRIIGEAEGSDGKRRAIVSLAEMVPSLPQVGQATRAGILPFTGSTSNA